MNSLSHIAGEYNPKKNPNTLLCDQGFELVCFSVAAALSPLNSPFDVDESPLRSHGHSWRQQIFLRVATPQKNAENIGKKRCIALKTSTHLVLDQKAPQSKTLRRMRQSCGGVTSISMGPKVWTVSCLIDVFTYVQSSDFLLLYSKSLFAFEM